MSISPPDATAIAAVCVAGGALFGVFIRGLIDARLNRAQMSEQAKVAAASLEQQRLLATQQLQTQHEGLVAQLDGQIKLAEHRRAEERALKLLEDRRALYVQVIAISDELVQAASRAKWKQENLEGKYGDIDWESEPKKLYKRRNVFDEAFGNPMKLAMEDAFADKSRNPERWIEYDNPPWEARQEALDARRAANAQTYRLADPLHSLELIAPQLIVDVVKSMYLVRFGSTDPMNCLGTIIDTCASLDRDRNQLLRLARSDLGGDVTLYGHDE